MQQGSTLAVSPPHIGNGTTSGSSADLNRCLENVDQAFWYDRHREAILREDEAPVNLRGLCYVPALPVEQLGDAEFRAAHGLRYAYVTGAMANGIGSSDLVEAMSRAGMV